MDDRDHPDLPRLRPGRARRPHGLHADHASLPTLERIADLSYGGPLTAILADNNSTDRTTEVAEETARSQLVM
jgi:hypothetical protein